MADCLELRRRLEMRCLEFRAVSTRSRTGLAQLVEHRVEHVRPSVRSAERSAGRRGRAEEGAGLDAVGHDRGGSRRATRSTPWMRITSLPAPSICAPMALRQLARSTTSGSRAAFSITVVAVGETGAAIIRFSVPVTVTRSIEDACALETRGVAAWM